MDPNIQKKTTSGLERLMFMITRVFALCGAVVTVAGIVILVVILFSPKSKATRVTYDDIAGELTSTDLGERAGTTSTTSPPSIQGEIPNNLKTLLSGDNSRVLQGWLRPLSESQKRDFLDNLSAVYDEAQRKFSEREDQDKILLEVVNKYKVLKLAKLNENELQKYAALATKAAYVAGIFALLLILSILSLVLVMLAIERNTRQDLAFSNRPIR